MNLQQFLDYRHDCPICSKPLKLSFHSKKQQNIKYEEDRLNITFRMDGLKKGQKDYRVIYSFGLNDNTWYVEYCVTSKPTIEDFCYNSMMDRFKDLDKNLKEYRFYKTCDCDRYNYSSRSFKLKYDGTLLDDLVVETEYLGLASKLPEGHRIVKIHNWLQTNHSTCCYSKQESDVWARNDSGLGDMYFLKLPKTILFTSQEEVIEKVGKYFLFS